MNLREYEGKGAVSRGRGRGGNNGNTVDSCITSSKNLSLKKGKVRYKGT